MPDRAFLYARQSVTREGSESLADQLRECRAAAKRLRLLVVEEVVEAPSTSGYAARGRNRQGFKRVLAGITSREADCVVVYKTDRLSRGGGPGWAPLIDAFESVGRELDRAVATPAGWLSEFEIGIRATMDREESKKTSDRMLAVRAREAREGKPRVTGRRPFGYTLDWSAVVEEEAALITEAARRVLGGETLWRIVLDWNERGVPTVTGKEWAVTVLQNILTSGRIAGLRDHHGQTVAPGNWPAIIDKDTHERLRVALAPKRTWRKPQPRRYPLVGLLRCGRCGAPMRSLAGGSGRPRGYGCRKLPGLGGCNGTRIPAEPVEEHIRDLVCGQLADPAARAALSAVVPHGSDDDHSALTAAVADIAEKRERLVDLYTDGLVDKAGFIRRTDAINAELEGLERQVAGRAEQSALDGLPYSFEELVRIWGERGVEFQRLLVTAVLGPITVGPGRQGRNAPVLERLQFSPPA